MLKHIGKKTPTQIYNTDNDLIKRENCYHRKPKSKKVVI